jgi:hypothetical protein
MISLITCCDSKFIKKAVECFKRSFEIEPSIKYTIYTFGNESINIEFPPYIFIKKIPQNVKNLNDPFLFAYKYWAILDSFLENEHVIYTDSTHVINKSLINIFNFYSNDCLLIRYKNGQFLIKDWTTKKCIEKLDGKLYLNQSQVWAGFQAYKNTVKNVEFIKQMLNSCLDSELSGPNPSIYKPDGNLHECIYHRNDQSILSILSLKYNIYPDYIESIDLSFGDYQSVLIFYPNEYLGDYLNTLNRYIYPRYLK